MYNEGISKVGDVLDMAVETGIVEKRGAFYSFGETRLGQGRENTKSFLRDNTAIVSELDGQVRGIIGLYSPVFSETEEDTPAEEEVSPELELEEELA
jgi:recombination protein RecA